MIAQLKQMSIHEFRQMEFDENDDTSYELINGYIIKKSAPRPKHTFNYQKSPQFT
jgi:Uma2 family endonuclease